MITLRPEVLEMEERKTIGISVEEYTRLKDIETRFMILKEEFLHAAYCPIHHQIILGIEKEYAQKGQALKLDLLPDALEGE